MATNDFDFGEPDVQVRAGRASWMDDEKQVKPVDALIDAFHAAFGKNGTGYARKVTKGLEKITATLPKSDSKQDATVRIAGRINQRAAAREVEVHARSMRGTLNLVIGPKPVVHRKKRTSSEEAPEPVAA